MYSAVFGIETWWVSSYTITAHLKHTNSTIIFNAWSDRFSCICRRMNKEPHYSTIINVRFTCICKRMNKEPLIRDVFSGVQNWDLVSFIVHYHCTFEAHQFYHYSMPDLIVCPIYVGERIRNRTNKRCIQWCETCWISSYTITAHFKHTLFNVWSDRLSCICKRTNKEPH